MADDFYPYSSDWLTTDRLSGLKDIICPNLNFWLDSGLLEKIIRYWIKTEVLKESLENKLILNDCQLPEFFSVTNGNPTQSDLRLLHQDQKLDVEKCLYNSWCNYHWGDRLYNLFLENKSDFDIASLRMLIIPDKGLATEIYHQLRAKEIDFSGAYRLHSELIPSTTDGFIESSSLKQLPYGLGRLVARLKTGEITSPLKLLDKFAIVKLEAMQPAQFDETTTALILSNRFNKWVGFMVSSAKGQLLG